MQNLSRLIIFSLLATATAQGAARPYATVTMLEGKAFGMHDEKTFPLKVGYKLPEQTDIITEEGAQVSFIDNFDRQFHLAGAAHLKVTNHALKIYRGYLWVKSFQRGQELLVKTANALAGVLEGEGIFSFDEASAQTQLLAIKGKFKFSHVLDIHRYEILRPGEFSVIDHAKTAPRIATAIGFESYEKITSLFRQQREATVAGESKKWAAKKGIRRSLASEPQRNSVPVIKTKLTARDIASIEADLKDLYFTPLKWQKKRGKRKRSSLFPVTTHVFGRKSSPRSLASIADTAPRGREQAAAQKEGSPASSERTTPPSSRLQVRTVAPTMVRLPAKATPIRPLTPHFKPKSTTSTQVRGQAPQRAPQSHVQGGGAAPWGFKQSLQRYLKKTSRQELDSEQLLKELKDHRKGYKTNH